jgi:hypothetical protein
LPGTEDSAQPTLKDRKTINQDVPTKWREVANPKDIEFHPLLRDRRHFGQADVTEFTRRTLRTSINWTGDSIQVELFLSVKYASDEVGYVEHIVSG